MESIYNSIQKANLDRFIHSTPKNVDTQIGEGAIKYLAAKTKDSFSPSFLSQ